MVPSVRDWVQHVLDHVQQQVHWVGGLIIGGPDENAELKVIRYVTRFLDAQYRFDGEHLQRVHGRRQLRS